MTPPANIYIHCRNKTTGTEWWARVPNDWRPPRSVECHRLSGAELKEAVETYELARTSATPAGIVHPMWSTPPDYTEPAYPKARKQPHHLQQEVAAIAARVGEIRAEIDSWPAVDWDRADLHKHEDYRRQLDTAQRFLESAARAMGSWTEGWPPERSVLLSMPLPPGYRVRLLPSFPMAALLPSEEMLATQVLVGEGDVSMVVTHPSLACGATIPTSFLEVLGVVQP